LERARPKEQLSDDDHGSLMAARVTKNIDAGEFEHKIMGQGYGISPHNLASDPIFRMPLFLPDLRL